MDQENRDNNDGIEGWYFSLPIVTRCYVTLIVAISVLCHFGFLSPLSLYFHYKVAFFRHQYWRVLTNFLYFGPLNVDFLFHMFFLIRYCRSLEEDSFHGRSADFFFMLLIGSFFMLLASPFLHLTFMGAPLTFMIVYVWARRNPFVLMNFLGIFTFTAPYMPWVLLGFALVLGGTFPAGDLVGIAVGHMYYYLEDVYPRMIGRRILKTPGLLKALFAPQHRPNYVNIDDTETAAPAAAVEQQQPDNIATDQQNGNVADHEQPILPPAETIAESNTGNNANSNENISRQIHVEEQHPHID